MEKSKFEILLDEVRSMLGNRSNFDIIRQKIEAYCEEMGVNFLDLPEEIRNIIDYMNGV